MRNIVPFLRRADLAEQFDIDAEELRIDPPSAPCILSRMKDATASALDRLRGAEMRLEKEIADRQEELRKVRIGIRAEEAAEAVLSEGVQAAAE